MLNYPSRPNCRYYVVYHQIYDPTNSRSQNSKPETIVIHAGGNNITRRKLQNKKTTIHVTSSEANIPNDEDIPISSILVRLDDAWCGVPFVNQEMRNICSKMGIGYINNANITRSNLDDFGITLNTTETRNCLVST